MVPALPAQLTTDIPFPLGVVSEESELLAADSAVIRFLV
jgi:hypothetical protein